MPGLFFVGVAVLIVIILVFNIIQGQKRRKELMAWAASNGFSFSPEKDAGMDERFPGFACLRKGSRRYACNCMRGRYHERRCTGFDYHYETYSTDSKGHRQTHHHNFSAMIIDSGYRLKPLSIRSEGLFDKLTEFIGFDDIDFESAEFSREFYVKAPDKRWAYDVIQQSTMELLLASPRFSLELQDRYCIAYRSSRFSVQDFQAALEVIEGIITRLPVSLVKEIAGE